MLFTGVQAVYWCTRCTLVYRLYIGVQAVYWCTGCILVYRLYHVSGKCVRVCVFDPTYDNTSSLDDTPLCYMEHICMLDGVNCELNTQQTEHTSYHVVYLIIQEMIM